MTAPIVTMAALLATGVAVAAAAWACAGRGYPARTLRGILVAAGLIAPAGTVLLLHSPTPAPTVPVVVGTAVTVGVAAAAAVIDQRYSIIPNRLSLLMWVVAAATWVCAGAPWSAWLPTLVVGAVMGVFYLAGMCGAGDVKFLPPVTVVACLGAGDLLMQVFTASTLMLVVGVTQAALFLHDSLRRSLHRALATPGTAGGRRAPGAARALAMAPAIFMGLVAHLYAAHLLLNLVVSPVV